VPDSVEGDCGPQARLLSRPKKATAPATKNREENPDMHFANVESNPNMAAI